MRQVAGSANSSGVSRGGLRRGLLTATGIRLAGYRDKSVRACHRVSGTVPTTRSPILRNARPAASLRRAGRLLQLGMGHRARTWRFGDGRRARKSQLVDEQDGTGNAYGNAKVGVDKPMVQYVRVSSWHTLPGFRSAGPPDSQCAPAALIVGSLRSRFAVLATGETQPIAVNAIRQRRHQRIRR